MLFGVWTVSCDSFELQTKAETKRPRRLETSLRQAALAHRVTAANCQLAFGTVPVSLRHPSPSHSPCTHCSLRRDVWRVFLSVSLLLLLEVVPVRLFALELFLSVVWAR